MIVLSVLLLTAVSVAAYPGYPVYDNSTSLAPTPTPTTSSPSASATPTPFNVSTYYIVLAVFGGVVFLAGLIFWFRHSRFNPWRPATPPPPARTTTSAVHIHSIRRSRRAGVWRADLEEGVPIYTLEAGEGELSLGVGRRQKLMPASEDDIEMDSLVEHEPAVSATEGEQTEEQGPIAVLPPYVPPSKPAVAATSESGSQRAHGNRSNESLTSVVVTSSL